MARSGRLCRLLSASFWVLSFFSSTMVQSQIANRITQPIDNRSVVKILSSTHPLARQLKDGGRVDPGLAMQRMLLVLKRSEQQEAALRKLVNDLHDPQSVHYRQWLKPEEFGASFGPAASDIAKVTSWLQQQGFQVSAVGRGKQFIEF